MLALLRIIIAILPLTLFVVPLIILDSFSLTKKSRLAIVVALAGLAYVLFYCINTLLPEALEKNPLWLSFIEELLKGLIVFVLIVKNKAALMSEATIYGAAVGAGFGTLEILNECLVLEPEMSLAHALFLGFETAVMHIGCTATFASMLVLLRRKAHSIKPSMTDILGCGAFFAAFAVHYLHLILPIHPVLLTAILTVYFIYSKRKLYRENDEYIHEWIDSCINNDIQLLSSIRQGQLSMTNAGKYLEELKSRFSPETFFDMICFVTEYLELSIAAKSRMILKEAGMSNLPDDPVKDARVAEIKALLKRIGYTGEQALKPLIDIKDVDKWVIGEI